MENYREVEGNLITLFQNGEFDVIIHGANCHNIMGAGIAKTIAETYPIALQRDKEFILPVGNMERLGNFSRAVMKDKDNNPKWILNAYTQYNPGRNLDYNALELVLKKINFTFSPEKIGLPLIGCGIAGGNWNVVKKIIQRQMKGCDVTIVHFKP